MSTGLIVLLVIVGVVVLVPAVTCTACVVCAAAVGSQDSPGGSGPSLSGRSPGAPAAPQRTFSLGEAFRLGSFSYQFTRVETRRTLGNRMFQKQASAGAVFVLVHYTELNEGSETATVLSGTMELQDARNRTFRSSSEAMTTLAMSGQNDLIASELQPGLQRDAVVAFELPEDAAQGQMTLVIPERGLFNTGQARVSLQAPSN